MALEKKQGVTNLELMCEELIEEERAKEQRQEKKRQKKKRKKAKAGKTHEKENVNIKDEDEEEEAHCVKVSGYINPLPDDRILDWSKFKQIADDILKCIQKEKISDI